MSNKTHAIFSSHTHFFQIIFCRYTSVSVQQHNSASVIYIFIYIFSDGKGCCANKTVKRKAQKWFTFFSDDPNTNSVLFIE